MFRASCIRSRGFKLAITSEIIGKLGGKVEEIPVEGTASGSNGTSTVLTTIDIPAGETWLVAAIGQKTGDNSIASNQPELHLGDVKIPERAPDGKYGLATVASGTISFSIKRNATGGTDSFTGHIYTVKM